MRKNINILYKWHDWLALPKFTKSWYEDDLAGELSEYEAETKAIKRWSELSDITYTCSRARWSGYYLPFPLKRYQYWLGLIYMLPKYTNRFLFFRMAGRKAGANKDIRCVRNPNKLEKIDETIRDQNVEVDLEKLKNICQKQRRFWLLLP